MNRVWSPINAIGKLNVDRNPVPYCYSLEESICNMIRCSRVGQYIECTGKITVERSDDKTILYAIWLCGSVSEFLRKRWFYFPYNKGMS